MAQTDLTPDSDEFICDMCGERFDTVSDLTAHKRSHLDPSEREDENDRDIRRDIGAPGLPTSPVS